MKSPAFDILVTRICEQLEKGIVPWRKPWANSTIPQVPTRSTGAAFTGCNVWLLAMAQNLAGYDTAVWLTYRQAQDLGGQVRAGEKGSLAILCNPREVDDPDSEDGGTKIIRFNKAYSVFNVAQIDGLDAGYYAVPEPRRPASEIEISDFLRRLPPIVTHKGDMAYYDTGSDRIVMPHPDQFVSLSAYQATLLHEYVHYTGAEHRLARPDLKNYRKHECRAKEELTAEFGALALGYHIGLPVDECLFDNHANYMNSWINVLKRNPEEILWASARAQKACDLLMQLAGDRDLQAAA